MVIGEETNLQAQSMVPRRLYCFRDSSRGTANPGKKRSRTLWSNTEPGISKSDVYRAISGLCLRGRLAIVPDRKALVEVVDPTPLE